MKGIWGILVALTALASAPAVAGTVYRCEGADGVRAYSSKKVPGARCVVASQYKGGGKASQAPAPAAMGSATPASQVAGSPTSVTPASLGATAAPATATPVSLSAPAAAPKVQPQYRLAS